MREVFVFGAGASNDSAHTPLGNELVWMYSIDSFVVSNVGGDRKLTLAEESIESSNVANFLDLVEQIYPELKEEKKKYKTLNEQGIVYMPPSNIDKKYYIDEIVRILQKRGNKEGVELIRQLVVKHIEETSFDRENLLYKKFTENLAKKSSEFISIISFNFDYLLHEDFKNEVYFNYFIDFNIIDFNRKSYNKKNSIPLIKLNGSLDWAICPKCGRKTLLFPHMCWHSYNSLLCSNCNKKLRPWIFLPHEEKDQLINMLWSKAMSAIREADKITIIGYSFPYYDKDVIALFKKNINFNIVLEIVDYEEKVEDRERREKEIQARFQQLFPVKKDIPVSLDGFNGYIERIFKNN